MRNRLFPKTRSWFALDSPLALLSPLSVLRLMFALAWLSWSIAAAIWPGSHHRVWVVGLSAVALGTWVGLLEVRRIRVFWCGLLSVLWIAQVSTLVWIGQGTGLSLAVTALFVPVGVFVALFFRLRHVVLCQCGIALCIWVTRVGSVGVGRSGFVALVGAICLSTAPFTVMLFNKSIRRAGTVDPETGLANGLGIMRRLEERETSQVLVTVSTLVRGLDSAREALGYQAGTELLRRTIENIGQVLPGSATIGRAELDELVVIEPAPDIAIDSPQVPNGASDLAIRLAETIERAVSAGRYTVDGVEILLRTHAGIAIAPWDGAEPAELLRRASLSAKKALEDGVSAVTWLADGRTLTADDLELLADLGMALERDELVVVFQPQIDARSGVVVGAEALLRWNSPTRGPVPPAVFIPMAERLGLIDRLTEWILPNALDVLAGWRRDGLDISMSVNLSPVTLLREDLADWVATEVSCRALPSRCLTLEITETVLADLTRAKDRLEPLRQLGVRISVDDFGSGYTSLSSLPALPLSELKVDQQFVRRSANSRNDLVIVRTVAELADRLGLVAVAEGVETPEVAGRMAELGYNVLQGFFAAPALSPGEFLRFARGLERNRVSTAEASERSWI